MGTDISRRDFLAAGGASVSAAARPVIDIHQHTGYSGRNDEELLAHQRALGITRTLLLPAGSRFGLGAGAGGNESAAAMARLHAGEFLFFANELPQIPEARAVLEKYLRAGALGIGEQKFEVPCDSRPMERIAGIAAEHGVPVLLHFEHGRYNTGFERFHKVLEKYPRVTFIGHAQTWWGNIDRKHRQEVMYPEGRVTPGGITDRLLSDYPNLYGDLSAASGLNALLRDEEHARSFLARHQDRLLYGSGCSDRRGREAGCHGWKLLEALRRLAPDEAALRKVLYSNAARVLKLN